MALNQQTANFPPIHQPEQSWALELRSLAGLLAPGSGVRSGLELGLPLSSGQPTTGLTPTLTDGYMLIGDVVLGPYGSKLISAAEKNWTNKKLYYGLAGMYYADAAAKPTDQLLGQLSTDNEATAAILHVAQPLNYGAARFGVRGVVNLAKCVKGADVPLFTWAKPAGLGLSHFRIVHAVARVATAVTAGNTAGDDFLLKAGSTTLATVAATNLVTANHTVVGSPVAAWNYGPGVDSIALSYNLTDTSTAIAGGSIEVNVIIEAF